MKTATLGLMGCGNIGSGLLRLISDMDQEIRQRYGIALRVKRALVRDLTKERNLPKGTLLTDDPDEILNDPEISLVVECMGGEEPAAALMQKALRSGKTVVTANKMALALHWQALHEAARQSGAELYYEASVCGAIPIIQTIRKSLQANRISAVMGIVNGTTNYILSRMTNEGLSYDQVLSQAQRLGLAEPDPASDVDGYDAAYKLSILASLAFHRQMPFELIHREGIRHIELCDIEAGKDLGLRLKLLAIAKQGEEGTEVRVHPAFVPASHPLAAVQGAFNAVFLHGHASGDMMLYGRGAGALPTAGAMLSDIIFALTHSEPEALSPEDTAPPVVTDNWRCAYYLRFMARNEPGVLGHIATKLGEHGVSIESLVQRGTPESGKVPVIVITHEAHEKAVQAAILSVDPERALAKSAIRLEGIAEV